MDSFTAKLVVSITYIFLITEEDVCFTVQFSGHPGSSYHNRKIVYNRVLVNVGSGYNVADGVFTAPQSGNYVFLWNVMTRTTECDVYLYKNGASTHLEAFADGASFVGNSDDSGSMSQVLPLSVGDRVWVYVGDCSYIYGNAYIAFTGLKIWPKNIHYRLMCMKVFILDGIL